MLGQQLDNEELTIEHKNSIISLKRIPGLLKIPFGRQYSIYVIDKLNGIGEGGDNLKAALTDIKIYCKTKKIAVNCTDIKLRCTGLKSKEIEEISTEVGFYRKTSKYWYIP